MNRPLTITLLICLVCLLASCTKTIYAPATSSERIIDTVMQTIADSSALRAVFECDSNNQVILRELSDVKGRQANQSLNFSDGELRIETRWQTKYIDRLREVHDTTTVIETREVVREVKHIPAFFWWCFAIALAGALYSVWQVVRQFKK